MAIGCGAAGDAPFAALKMSDEGAPAAGACATVLCGVAACASLLCGAGAAVESGAGRDSGFGIGRGFRFDCVSGGALGLADAEDC